MKPHCDRCDDTGSLSKSLIGALDCPSCTVAAERAQLEQWAIINGIRCNDTESLWMIYRHGQEMALVRSIHNKKG